MTISGQINGEWVIAELITHVDRLDSLRYHLDRCNKQFTLGALYMEKLSALKEKTKAKVIEILGDTHFQSRIISIGITVGSEIEVIQNYKKQPVLIYCRNTAIAVNKKEADKIMMEIL